MLKASWKFCVPLLLALAAPACVPGEYYVDTPPPAPQEEVVGVAPYPNAVYVNGYWGWEGGRHVWHRGAWQHNRPGYVYAPHRWEQRGNRYVMHRGGWRRR